MYIHSFVLLAILAILGQQAQHSSACLECYVTEKLEKFPQWILDNNLDPSPPMNESQRFSESNIFLSLDTELRNLTIEGYSNNLRPSWIDANLLRGTFSCSFLYVYDVTLTGEHVTNGTVLSQTPLNGEGQWRIRASTFSFSSLEIQFEILSTGFFNLTNSNLYSMGIGNLEEAEIYFENLSDNEAVVGYEEYLNAALFDGVQRAINNDGSSSRDPIRSAFRKFWQDELAKTTLPDVIGSTALPPGWTTAYTDQPPSTFPTTTPSQEGSTSEDSYSTSTLRTTQDPCVRADAENIKEPQVVSEEVLETIRGIDKNGTPVIYTKKLVITKKIQEEL